MCKADDKYFIVTLLVVRVCCYLDILVRLNLTWETLRLQQKRSHMQNSFTNVIVVLYDLTVRICRNLASC